MTKTMEPTLVIEATFANYAFFSILKEAHRSARVTRRDRKRQMQNGKVYTDSMVVSNEQTLDEKMDRI